MSDRRFPPPEDGDPNIADAEALFRDSPAPAPKPRVAPKTDADAGGHYDIEDLPDEEPVRPVSIPVPVERPRVAKKPKPEGPAADEAAPPDTSATVDQVWTRGAEWGKTLALLALAALAEFGLIFFLLSNELFTPAFLVMLCSVPVLVVVGYPILITLERPVRVTPEQAVNDYFTALSHHAPHYRRMWLLLSSAGRVSGSYASFEGFRAYWKKRLAELRAGRASGFTPLKFQIEDFRSEKSAGLTKINANFTVNVFVRGKQDEGPVLTSRVSMSLVKGPDRMWYLNKGTLA